MRRARKLRDLLIAVVVAGFGEASAQSSSMHVDFDRDVRPILADACFRCHGPDEGARKSKLRLDVREVALAPAESGAMAIVPRDPAASELVHRITSDDVDERMPPQSSGRVLTAAQRDLLTRWVGEGAEYATHWAYVAPREPELPEVHDPAWIRNPIDRFVLARIEAEGLAPSPETDRATLLRRVTLDLTGLPPSIAELDAFFADASADAYERVVDRLLASPHYGERMALPWLDAARYADSNGFQQEGDTYQYVWRDWLVSALNANEPFDRFATDMLAGDLLDGATVEQRIATGFNRCHLLNGEGGAIPEEQRNVVVFDRVDVTATTFLGLTMACAQCHDHKFDPITQRDYYQLFALFNQVPETGVPPGGGQYRIADPWVCVGTTDQDPRVMVMSDAQPRATHVLARGNYEAPLDEVQPGSPAFLPPWPDGAPRNRLGLAKWLFLPEHPLTARVQANRAWQLFFGTGVVKTSENFGVQGERPSHPELLDWLAVDLREHGWDMKRLHREIVTSATYRQSSRAQPRVRERDPENRLLARASRFRLPSLLLRDVALAASGLLDARVGGKPVYPYQPAGIWESLAITKERDFTYPQSQGADLFRRSLYTFWRRTVAPGNMFDSSARQTCKVRLSITSTPMHALTMLNDPTWIEAGRALAQDVLLHERETDARLCVGFRRVCARTPSADELAVLRRGLERARAMYGADPAAAARYLAIGASPRDATIDAAEHAAWATVCLSIFNLDEAMTRE